MKKVLLAAVVVTVALGFAGCKKQETKSASGDKGTYEAALASAKEEQKKAAAAGGEWRDTGKIIQSAEKAAADGDYGKATSLASKAADQGRLGQEQAASQVNSGNPSYLY
ncbi:hypothetical protein [Thiosocius teredinicola]|uniref:hypothetical protein n=1 Tax=Thiosocius teredinicola TaxID=1973002 RepID=UPI000990F150